MKHTVISEFLAFDKAATQALSFAQERDDTILIILEDHGTGGISIGSHQSDSNYASYPLSDIVGPLFNAKITANGALELLADGKDPKEVLSLYGINDPTKEELEYITNLEPDLDVSTSASRIALGSMLSKRCNIGWTTHGHTGEDVLLYSYLPGNERITGLFENTDIVKIITDAWGSELTANVCNLQHRGKPKKQQITTLYHIKVTTTPALYKIQGWLMLACEYALILIAFDFRLNCCRCRC